MAEQTSVRYTTRDEAAAEANQSLIDAVFAELAERDPDGLSYRVARSEDGLSFEHVAVVDGEVNPLLALASFQAFSSTVAERVLEPPVVRTWSVVARYRLSRRPTHVRYAAASSSASVSIRSTRVMLR